VGTESTCRLYPRPLPILIGLRADAIQARADLAQRAGRVLCVTQDLGTLGGRQVFDWRIRLEAQIRADLPAALRAGDLMTAKATILADQVIATDDLGAGAGDQRLLALL